MELIGELFIEIVARTIFGGVIAFFRWCFGQYMGYGKTFMDYFKEDITTKIAIVILQGLCIMMFIGLILMIIGVITS